MTMTVAFGTSMPTSITVVATSTSISPAAKARIVRVLLIGRHLAVQQAEPADRGSICVRSRSNSAVAALQVDLLGLLDQRIDDVRLAARRDLLADEIVDARRASAASRSAVCTGCRPGGSSSRTESGRGRRRA